MGLFFITALEFRWLRVCFLFAWLEIESYVWGCGNDLSSVCVVLNALRLKFFKPRHMTSASENLQDNTETCPIQTVAERSASPAVSQIENNQKKDEGEKQVMTKL